MEKMKIPEGENVCCAADLFEYDEEKKLNLREFFRHYKDQFPMLIVIIGGHYGLTKYDCYDNFQVLRVHCYTSQPRVVADDARLNPTVQKGYLTIPEDTLIKFRVVKGHTKVGSPQPLWEILQENDQLPLIVQTACDSGYPIRIGTTKYEARDLGNVMIKEKYEEHYFLMNAIDTVELDMNKLTCMACLSEDLDATPITGFKYASKAEFDEFCQKLAKDVAESDESYDNTQGSDDFGEYSFDEMRSLLEISNKTTGLLMDDQEDDDSPGECDYVDMPPLLPSRNPISKQSTPEGQPSPNQKQKEIHKVSLQNKPTSHSFKSPHSPKVHHTNAKSVLGFLKKKLNRNEEKEDELSNEREAPVTHTHSHDGQTSNIEQSPSPPKVPPHVKKNVDKPDSYSYADVKAGYVKISAHKPYINTQIGRATVKPMQQVKNNGDDTNYMKMKIEGKEEEEEGGEELYETLDENISMDQIITNPTKDLGKRTPSTDKETVKENLTEQTEESSEELEEYETCEFAKDLQQGNKESTVSSPAPVPSRSPKKQEDKPSGVKDKYSPPDVRERVDFTEIVKSMSINDVCEHLKSLKLGKYAETFEENQIDGIILISLSVDDLQKELGLRKIEAIKLNKFATTGHIPR